VALIHIDVGGNHVFVRIKELSLPVNHSELKIATFISVSNGDTWWRCTQCWRFCFAILLLQATQSQQHINYHSTATAAKSLQQDYCGVYLC